MIKKQVLPNGIRVIHEHLPHVRSCAVGIWVQSGTRHEPAGVCGISHFIEHMLFKGTATYSAHELAKEFDSVGGQVNAFTTKENTCYYVRVLDSHLQKAADLLADMFFNSAFNEEDVNLERGVIVEEIGMYEDSPEDLCNEILYADVYKGTSLSRPILGTKESLQGINGAILKEYQKAAYTPQNTIISLSGSYTANDLDHISRLFGALKPGTPPAMESAVYTPSVALKKKDIEQNHLIMAFPGIHLGSEERYAMQVLNNILGSGMSSRLFQSVREKQGLCYSVYSFSSMYVGAGTFGIYTALNKETENQALALIRKEVESFIAEGPTDDELLRTKEQIKSTVLMGMESTSSRMSNLARNEITFGRHVSEEEIVEKIDAVTKADILSLSAKVMDFNALSFAAVGNVSAKDEYLNILKG